MTPIDPTTPSIGAYERDEILAPVPAEFLATTPNTPELALHAEARSYVAERLRDGVECPTCGQNAQVYRRHFNATNARLLAAAVRAHRLDPFHAPTSLPGGHGGEWARLAYWHLIEEAARPATRDEAQDPAPSRGWWRVSRLGLDFALNRTQIARVALVYDARRVGLVGPPITIREALAEGVDLGRILGPSFREILDDPRRNPDLAVGEQLTIADALDA